jgi:hypothetical protein
MYYNDSSDGTIWSRGRDYKASFSSQGVTYFPAFGPRQPHAVSHALSPDLVTIGGEPLVFEPSAPAARHGDHVEIDRRGFIESYDLSIDTVEQRFEFPSLPRGGELVVHIPVASELESREGDQGIEFRGALGSVLYGRATAIDGAGRTVPALTELEDGSIVIHVDDRFLATAIMPLVIDPVVQSFQINTSNTTPSSPDAAYDASTHSWCVVYLEPFSGTQNDLFVGFLLNDGQPVGGYYVAAQLSWDHVRVANLALAHQFLIVGAATCCVGPRFIEGLETRAGVFDVSGAEGGFEIHSPFDLVNPDVGGDPWVGSGPSYYCLVYNRILAADHYSIAARLVDSNATLVGSEINLSNFAHTIDTLPAISKSDRTSEWLIVWQRDSTSSSTSDIWGARVRWDGTVSAGPFQISLPLDPQPKYLPSASSLLNGTDDNLVAWQENFTTDNDIEVALVQGGTILDVNSLSYMENFDLYLDQIEPSVDSDGERFVVSYSESPNYNVYASELYVLNNQLQLAQAHVDLFAGVSPQQERRPRAVSMAAAGETDPVLKHRFLCTWDVAPGSSGYGAILGSFFDVFNADEAVSFCFGDGSSVPGCPCSNTGFPGRGCDNSSHTGGALLTASGVASIAGDTLLFTTQAEKATALSVVNQGDAQVSPTAFGQGLRCAGGHVKRLYSHSASGGSISAPTGTDPNVHTRSAALGDPLVAGSVRYYYVYYRDQTVLGGCPSTATFNTTQSVQVTWAP